MLCTFKLSMNFLVMGNWRARTLGHIGASLAREVICHAIYLGTVEIGTENNIYNYDSKLFEADLYTANGYRQTTDKLMFKRVISTVR